MIHLLCQESRILSQKSVRPQDSPVARALQMTRSVESGLVQFLFETPQGVLCWQRAQSERAKAEHKSLDSQDLRVIEYEFLQPRFVSVCFGAATMTSASHRRRRLSAP